MLRNAEVDEGLNSPVRLPVTPHFAAEKLHFGNEPLSLSLSPLRERKTVVCLLFVFGTSNVKQELTARVRTADV